jgi:hypothetical protein
LHTVLAVVAALGSHLAFIGVDLYVKGDKGKEVEWVSEANLQGTDTIAGCRCRCELRCRKMGLVSGWYRGYDCRMVGVSRKRVDKLMMREVDGCFQSPNDSRLSYLYPLPPKDFPRGQRTSTIRMTSKRLSHRSRSQQSPSRNVPAGGPLKVK